MQDLLRWLASFKGIPVEPGADLRFEFAAFPTGGLALLTLLGLVLALTLVALVYRRDGRNLTRGQRICLATLRILAVFAAFAVILEPNLVAVKKEVRDGHAIILLDLSVHTPTTLAELPLNPIQNDVGVEGAFLTTFPYLHPPHMP